MISAIVLFIFAACVAYAAHAWIVHRREERECGRLMGVRYAGHVALNRRRLSGGGAGVTPEQRAGWQYEVGGPSATDLLFDQMEEQRLTAAYRRRENEIDQHWRDEENRRRDEERQREDDYWARRRDDY